MACWGPRAWESLHSTLSYALWKRIWYEALQRDDKARTFYWAYKVMSVMRLHDRLLAWLPWLSVVLVKEVYGLWDPFAFFPEHHVVSCICLEPSSIPRVRVQRRVKRPKTRGGALKQHPLRTRRPTH